jgi:hypothetical protein
MNGTSALSFRGQWSDHNRFGKHGYKHPEPLSTFISISRLEKTSQRVSGSKDLAVGPSAFFLRGNRMEASKRFLKLYVDELDSPAASPPVPCSDSK